MEEKRPKNWVHLGCSVVVAILLVIGLAQLGLQWLGYLPSERGLRKAATLAVDEVRVEGQQAIVRIKLDNGSKWAMSAGIECNLVDADGRKIAAQRVEALDVAPGESAQREVRFDLDELAKAGMVQPAAANMRLSLRWVCEAGQESGVLLR